MMGVFAVGLVVGLFIGFGAGVVALGLCKGGNQPRR